LDAMSDVLRVSREPGLEALGRGFNSALSASLRCRHFCPKYGVVNAVLHLKGTRLQGATPAVGLRGSAGPCQGSRCGGAMGVHGPKGGNAIRPAL